MESYPETTEGTLGNGLWRLVEKGLWGLDDVEKQERLKTMTTLYEQHKSAISKVSPIKRLKIIETCIQKDDPDDPRLLKWIRDRTLDFFSFHEDEDDGGGKGVANDGDGDSRYTKFLKYNGIIPKYGNHLMNNLIQKQSPKGMKVLHEIHQLCQKNALDFGRRLTSWDETEAISSILYEWVFMDSGVSHRSIETSDIIKVLEWIYSLSDDRDHCLPVAMVISNYNRHHHRHHNTSPQEIEGTSTTTAAILVLQDDIDTIPRIVNALHACIIRGGGDILNIIEWIYSKKPEFLSQATLESTATNIMSLLINDGNLKMAKWVFEKDPTLLFRLVDNESRTLQGVDQKPRNDTQNMMLWLRSKLSSHARSKGYSVDRLIKNTNKQMEALENLVVRFTEYYVHLRLQHQKSPRDNQSENNNLLKTFYEKNRNLFPKLSLRKRIYILDMIVSEGDVETLEWIRKNEIEHFLSTSSLPLGQTTTTSLHEKSKPSDDDDDDDENEMQQEGLSLFSLENFVTGKKNKEFHEFLFSSSSSPSSSSSGEDSSSNNNNNNNDSPSFDEFLKRFSGYHQPADWVGFYGKMIAMSIIRYGEEIDDRLMMISKFFKTLWKKKLAVAPLFSLPIREMVLGLILFWNEIPASEQKFSVETIERFRHLVNFFRSLDPEFLTNNYFTVIANNLYRINKSTKQQRRRRRRYIDGERTDSSFLKRCTTIAQEILLEIDARTLSLFIDDGGGGSGGGDKEDSLLTRPTPEGNILGFLIIHADIRKGRWVYSRYPELFSQLYLGGDLKYCLSLVSEEEQTSVSRWVQSMIRNLREMDTPSNE